MLTRRLLQLLIGLAMYGVSLAIFIRAGLGLDPWDVFHQGLAIKTGLSIGTVVVIVSFLVLLLWIPLRQWPGFGTLCNAVLVGVFADIGLALIPEVTHLVGQIGMLVGAIVLNGIASACYIGARLGPGARDGLMTGLARRTGWSLRTSRTGIEIVVLGAGWLLGGSVGVGTVLYALAIGPLVQLLLPRFTVPEARPAEAVGAEAAGAEPAVVEPATAEATVAESSAAEPTGAEPAAIAGTVVPAAAAGGPAG
ncbi:YitT family protein [Arthrobacter sp. 2MCAF15]|uniref:membrane protein YczE n=1 Tax=Arthrobacter sp. 2MCAF15 TaxID=3232984 RepID=UPI003F92D4B3